MKYLLIKTDGYSIETEGFLSEADCYKSMLDAYNAAKPEEWDESFEDMSYISETDAILYANGEEVFVWRIISVK